MQKDDGTMQKIAVSPKEAESAERIADEEQFQQIMKKNSGLIFHVGEKVKLKDGDFRIQSIGKKCIVLEGLPGTRINK